MARHCPSCGNPVEAGDMYCTICGNPVAPEASSRNQSRPSAQASNYVGSQATGVTRGGYFEVPIEQESGYDIAKTEIWGVDSAEVPQKPDTRDDSDDEAISVTVIARPLDDEDNSPTIAMVHERYVLLRQKNGERIDVEPPCMIGRGTAAGSRVRGNRSVSRQHAKLFLQDGEVLIQDLASTNGTYVDGRRLEEDESAPLANGSVVRLGDEDFVFSVEVLQ